VKIRGRKLFETNPLRNHPRKDTEATDSEPHDAPTFSGQGNREPPRPPTYDRRTTRRPATPELSTCPPRITPTNYALPATPKTPPHPPTAPSPELGRRLSGQPLAGTDAFWQSLDRRRRLRQATRRATRARSRAPSLSLSRSSPTAASAPRTTPTTRRVWRGLGRSRSSPGQRGIWTARTARAHPGHHSTRKTFRTTRGRSRPAWAWRRRTSGGFPPRARAADAAPDRAHVGGGQVCDQVPGVWDRHGADGEWVRCGQGEGHGSHCTVDLNLFKQVLGRAA
jgi:hypothetical protein